MATIDKLSQSQIRDLADEIAPNWETVCSRMNIEPNKIKMYVHQGATQIEYSRKFMDHLYGRCTPLSDLQNALNKSGLQRIATMIPNIDDNYVLGWYYNPFMSQLNDWIGSDYMFFTLCNALGMADRYNFMAHNKQGRVHELLNAWEQRNGNKATKLNFCIQIRKFQLLAIAEMIENTPIEPQSFSAPKSASAPASEPRSNPFHVETKVENFSTFVKKADPYYLKICVIMNEHNLWQILPRKYGVLSNPGAAQLMIQISSAWEKKENNPADIIFKLLADTDIGNKSLDQLTQDLLSIDSPELKNAVDGWIEFRNQVQTNQIDKNTSDICSKC